jgi:microcystin-dependent protein
MTRHTHIQNEHTHTQDSHSHTQDSHNHGVSIGWNPSGWEAANFGIAFFGSYTNTIAVTGGWDIGSTGVAPAIQNNTATNNENTATNQNTGGGQAHNNIQPYIVMNYAIRFQ